MSRLLALLFVATASSPIGIERPLTVGEVLSRVDELDGKLSEVQGFVLKCQRLGCALRDSADPTIKAKALSIGGSGDFDSEIQEFLGKRVVVKAKHNATCLRGHAICLDRPDDLEHPELMNAAQ